MGKDRISRARRSWNMSRIRGKDTAPEKVVRSLLHRMGYRLRLYVRIPTQTRNAEHGARNSLSSSNAAPRPRERERVAEGRVRVVGRKQTSAERARVRTRNPGAVSVDILLPKHKTALFVHGCFWHRHRGCKNCTTPTHRRKWWLAKLEGNAARDKLHQRALRKLGWRTIVIWECQTEKPANLERLESTLDRTLSAARKRKKRRL